MAEITDKLKKEFIQACENANGQFLTAPGHLDCLLRSKPFCVLTLYSGSSKAKVETKTSYVELNNVKSISSIANQKSHRRISILSKKGDWIGIGYPAPDHVLVEFESKDGVKGTSIVHKSQRECPKCGYKGGPMTAHMSDWFKEGLKEVGISEDEYQSMTQKEKNETKEMLKEFGH